MAADLTLDRPRTDSALRRFLTTRHWTFAAGSAMFVTVVAILVLGPAIWSLDPSAQNIVQRLKPPSAEHWLGTDNLGRDVFARLVEGGRFTVTIAAVSVVISVVIGVAVGVIAGRVGGWFEEVSMRVVDLLIAIPETVIAIFLVAIFGPGHVTLIVALTIVGWTPYARLSRGLALQVNAMDYIRAAEVLGMTRSFILTRHFLPNLIRPISAVTFLRFGHKLITVGGLSYLGLGVQPPAPDWGLMLAAAQPYLDRAPMLMVAPGLAIFVTALSVTWIGHGLDIDRTRPKS
ncbi:MAG: ABC transporter permease [Rhodobacteraceae bacterium]|jgi:peptide/nickel transport system permease protein|nr:ABC transporter permease [Paracoccaceae bacterium]